MVKIFESYLRCNYWSKIIKNFRRSRKLNGTKKIFQVEIGLHEMDLNLFNLSN